MIRHPDLPNHHSPWFESRRKITFSLSHTGEVQVPYFVMTMTEASDKVYFSIHQKDIRCINSKPYIDFGVTVLQETTPGHYKLITSTGNSADRQNQTKEMSLPSGTYLIVPTSTGCLFREYIKIHQLRQHQKCLSLITTPIKAQHENDLQSLSTPLVATGAVNSESVGSWMTLLDANGKEKFVDSITEAYSKVFHCFDIDNDGRWCFSEFEEYIYQTEATTFETPTKHIYDLFTTIVDVFDNNNINSINGRNNIVISLSLDGFLSCQLFAFIESGRKEEIILKDLSYMGLELPHQVVTSDGIGVDGTDKNRTINDMSICSCGFDWVSRREVTLVIHSTNPHHLKPMSCNK